MTYDDDSVKDKKPIRALSEVVVGFKPTPYEVLGQLLQRKVIYYFNQKVEITFYWKSFYNYI